MYLIIIFLIIVFILLIYGFYSGFTTLHINKRAKKDQCRVACVGDSITYGCCVKNWPKNNYPTVLGKMMGQEYCVNNYGYSGRTMMRSGDFPYTEKAIFRKSLNFEPEIVIVKFGTNDAKTHNWKGKEVFKTEYRLFLSNYQQLKSKPDIYLCTPATAYYLNNSVDGKIVGNVIIPKQNLEEAVEAVKELGQELNIPVIDIHSFTKEHREWFAEGLHPNALGAKMLAEEIYRNLRKNIEDKVIEITVG